MIGINALRRAWRQITTFHGTPLARAVRTSSSDRTSSIAERVTRVTYAAEIRPRLIAGSVIDWYQAMTLPERALITGNQGRAIANTSNRMMAETNGGNDNPSSEEIRTA